MSNAIKTHLEDLTALLAADFENGRTIDKRCRTALPDRADVKTLVYDLNRLVYAGYYTQNPCPYAPLEDTMERLAGLIAKALRFDPMRDGRSDAEYTQLAEAMTVSFFFRLPAVRALLDKDIEALFDGDPAAESKDAVVVTYPGLFAISVYRYAHELAKLSVPILPRMMTEFAHSKTGIDINPGATIGEYFFIDHGTGVVIGETTEIGDHVKIYQGVTLGALSTRDGRGLVNKKRHPTIGDNVTIYSNASILGGDTVIGEGSVIGGNVFLTASVPPNTKVYKRGDEANLELPKEG